MKRLILTVLDPLAVVLGPQVAQATDAQSEPTNCPVAKHRAWQQERLWFNGTRRIPEVRWVDLTVYRCEDGYTIRHKVLSPWRVRPIGPPSR